MSYVSCVTVVVPLPLYAMIFNMVKLWSVVMFGLCISSLLAQEISTISTTRPKIGLALSGGSAHGFAHVGVIKYLEEQGIEVDYVTGTSMGSVVGGLYAMGFDADEIAEIAGNLDWDLLMSNRVPLDEVAPIEKAFHERIPISALWKNSSFRLPRGFIRGQKLDLVISRVYAPAYYIEHFDQFRLPFRCVAVDIEDGSIDVLENGFVGNSIRASMAIPTVFPPKELNDRLYVDGGLLRNFPVTEVIDMGADFVIGVYVGSNKALRGDLHSMFDIMKQSASMGNLLDSELQKEMTDILILPDVKEHGTFDFINYQHCIEMGYEAAAAHAPTIKALAERLSQYTIPERPKKLEYPTSLRFSEIKITNAEPVFEKMIRNRMHCQENYATTVDEVEEGLSLVYGTKNFSRTSYSYYNTDEGELGLEVDVEKMDPFILGLNINRFKLYNSALILSGEARNVLGKPSSFRMDARISDYPGLQGHYFIRLPSWPSFIFRASAKLEKSQLPFHNLNRRDRTYAYQQGYAQAEFIKEWKNKYMVGAAIGFVQDEIKPEAFSEVGIIEYQSERSVLSAYISHNSLDQNPYPGRGLDYKFTLSHVFSNVLRLNERQDSMTFLRVPREGSYQKADFRLAYYRPMNSRLTMEFSMKSRLDFGTAFLDSYRVGGPIQEKTLTYGFLGINDSELLVGSHISGKFGFRFQLKGELYLSPAVQYLYGNDVLAATFRRPETVSVLGGGLTLGLNSPIGPVSVDFGYSTLKKEVVINLGLGYRHIF